MTDTQRLAEQHPAGARCHYCPTDLAHDRWPGTTRDNGDGTRSPARGTAALTADHATPRARGGTRVVPCCPRCNARKGTRAYLDFVLDPDGQTVARASDVRAPGWMR